MIKLIARPEPSKFWTYASPVLALVVTVVIGVLLFMALGKDPVKGLGVFFWEPVKSANALSELMVKADHCTGSGGVLSLKCVEHWR
jgi:simple sugar transport system permease protein